MPKCYEGHKGANCEACDLENELGTGNWAYSAEFACSNCAYVTNNAIKIGAMTLLNLVLMYISVGGTVNAVQDKIKLNALKILFDTHDPTPDE